MGKTRIDWANFSLNPIKGLCPVDCKDNQGKSYCYARRLYKRFGWNPEIRFEPEEMLDLGFVKDGERVFIGSTIELFHDSIPEKWIREILWYIKRCHWATCILLTKQPQNLIKWSPFPDNCWVGATVTDADSYRWAMAFLSQISARVKFLSIEPFLSQFWLRDWEYQRPLNAILDWVIIGQQTPVKPATMPKLEWVKEIVEAADKANIPVFQKDNLKSLLGDNLRQEFPK